MNLEDTAALVRGAAEGDQSAWARLVERHSNLLRGIARGYRLGDAQVDDVVQTAWLRLVEHLPELREPERVTGWLVTTVRRECLTVLRATRRELPVLSEDDEFWGSVGSAEHEVLEEQDREQVRQALSRLPERQRAVLQTLMWAPELDYRQVGAALSMPVGSIGPTRGRALLRIRELLEDAVPSDAAA